MMLVGTRNDTTWNGTSWNGSNLNSENGERNGTWSISIIGSESGTRNYSRIFTSRNGIGTDNAIVNATSTRQALILTLSLALNMFHHGPITISGHGLNTRPEIELGPISRRPESGLSSGSEPGPYSAPGLKFEA